MQTKKFNFNLNAGTGSSLSACTACTGSYFLISGTTTCTATCPVGTYQNI